MSLQQKLACPLWSLVMVIGEHVCNLQQELLSAPSEAVVLEVLHLYAQCLCVVGMGNGAGVDVRLLQFVSRLDRRGTAEACWNSLK